MTANRIQPHDREHATDGIGSARYWLSRADLLVYICAHVLFNAFCLFMLLGWLPVSATSFWLLLGTLSTLALAYVDYKCLMLAFAAPRGEKRPRSSWRDIPARFYLILHAMLITVLILSGAVPVVTLLIGGFFVP